MSALKANRGLGTPGGLLHRVEAFSESEGSSGCLRQYSDFIQC
jgi:hypothetical protein